MLTMTWNVKINGNWAEVDPDLTGSVEEIAELFGDASITAATEVEEVEDLPEGVRVPTVGALLDVCEAAQEAACIVGSDDDDVCAVLAAVADCYGGRVTPDIARDLAGDFVGIFASAKAFAQNYLAGYMDIPDALWPFIDWERLGDSAAGDFHWVDLPAGFAVFR